MPIGVWTDHNLVSTDPYQLQIGQIKILACTESVPVGKIKILVARKSMSVGETKILAGMDLLVTS